MSSECDVVVQASEDILVSADCAQAGAEISVTVVSGGIGPQGPQGTAGQGVPTGGTTGQVLAKASGTNYDTTWVTGGGGGSSAWADITGKPSTFTPSAHTHAIADTTGLQAALDAKAATNAPTFTGSVTFSDGGSAAQAQITGGSIKADAIWFIDTGPFSQQRSPYTNTERDKLAGIATGATANATDAQLRDRATHTGTQAVSTLATTGTASASTFLRGDGAWAAIATYTLPNATTSTLGGVIVGTGLGVTSGTASVTYGTTAGTACQGNDSRLADSRAPSGAAGGDLTGSYPNPQIAAGAVVTADLADSAVTTAKIAASAVTDAKIADVAASKLTGTIATARLGSGTASASTFLRGDQTYATAPVTSVDGSTGAVTITKVEVLDFTVSSKPSAATGSGGVYTYTVPAAAKAVRILCVGGGAGGGSGRRGATSTARGGGAGGSGAAAYSAFWAVADLPSTALTIYAPSGGAGGAAATADNTDGSFGGNATETYVTSSGTKIVSAWATSPGGNGTTSGGSIYSTYQGGVGGDYTNNGSPMRGGAGSATGAGANGEQLFRVACTGGGGGGAATSANASGAGGDSWIPYMATSGTVYNTDTLQGGTAGGGNGANGQRRSGWQGPLGGGGSGGGGNASGAGGNGGNGAFPGGGGGGGGASLNGNNSGAGGNGGGALVRITVYY